MWVCSVPGGWLVAVVSALEDFGSRVGVVGGWLVIGVCSLRISEQARASCSFECVCSFECMCLFERFVYSKQ